MAGYDSTRMLELLLGLVLGGVIAALAAWIWFRRSSARTQVDVHSTILRFRAVGELVVFRMVNQQIVTAESHPAGRMRELLGWLLSSKKMALVVEYGIDFKYDLRDPGFRVEPSDGGVRVVMPPMQFQPHVRDIRFYDERNARWLPFFLGDITEGFGPRFDESEKNKLLATARAQADQLALKSVDGLRDEVQGSARRTFEALARGFGVETVRIEFADAAPIALETKPGGPMPQIGHAAGPA